MDKSKDQTNCGSSAKPCPFCGKDGASLQHTEGIYTAIAWVSCCFCGARGPSVLIGEGQTAMSRWQERIKSDEAGRA